QHVVITDTSGVTASALDIARISSNYFDGIIDEVRLSNVVRSAFWIATEYNNQEDPGSFFSVGGEETPFTDLQVNAIDLYGNPIPNVNISMYENDNLIRTDIADENGSVIFEDLISIEEKYNFTVFMTSNIAPYYTIEINSTSEGILIGGASQVINLICNVSRNIFNVVDLDGIPVDSGWIIVGNSSNQIQNCTINNVGQATFRWLDIIPYDYNYTIWYHDLNYNPNKIILGSGDIIAPNSDVNVTVPLTTVNFTVLTHDAPITPLDGAKLILDNLNSGQSIVNLTTDINGTATLRWVDSSFISSNYSLMVSFYGQLWDFEIPELMTGRVGITNFTVTTSTAYTIQIHFAPTVLEELETQLVSLNPTDYIEAEWGTKIKLRALFNVTKVPAGFENLTGPTYADSISIQILDEGETLIQSVMMFKEDDYIGTHHGVVETDNLESKPGYILKIVAQKSGYVLPLDIIIILNIFKNNLRLNQSQNDDSPQSVYWQESIDLSVKPYGIISESFTLDYNIYNYTDHTFEFSIPEIKDHWNLSQITFNIYNISWNALPDDINITITLNGYGIYSIFNTSNHNGHNYALGTWTGIELDIDKSSLTGDNNFEFSIGGSFNGPIDIIADAVFIRDKINVQYSRFNITEVISLLPPGNGWAIKNITFELYNCYNTSNWSEVDPLNDINLNISTNEGIKYPLDSGSSGLGKLNIHDRIIYPLDNQFLFTIEANPDIMFDVTIKVEYIQELYQNQYLELFSLSITEESFNKGGTLHVNLMETEWIEDYARLEIDGITDYLLPSELAMNITINGQEYSINDVIPGEGIFSLESFDRNTIYSAFIETNQLVSFNLLFTVKYSRVVYYETKGIVTYYVKQEPGISGIVQYYEELGYYMQSIDTSLLDAEDYRINFTIVKDHYKSASKILDLSVESRLTLLNGSSGFYTTPAYIFIKDAVNFTFLYTDAVKGIKITDLTSQNYIWERREGVIVIDSGQGTLITTADNFYVLDLDTENLPVGTYVIIVTLGKKNYEYRYAIFTLIIEKRNFDISLSDNFKNNKVSVKQGKSVTIEIELKDNGNPVLNATILLKIGGKEYEFDYLENGTYILYFDTGGINAFFTSKTLNGIINISKEDYLSVEFTITIVVEMEEIFPGMPTFYFLLIVSAVVVFVGSIVTYRVYKHARIPEFVKKVRSVKKAIKGEDNISDSLMYRSKEVFIGEIVKNKWEKLKIPLENIVGSYLDKVQKISKVKRNISILGKVHDQKPIGLALMRWNERIGTEILAKYPEDMNISSKTLMQVYSTHEYSGEKGIITLMDGSLNIISYYTGPETGYYFLLILNIDDDPDVYEGGMADILHIIIQNLEEEAYLQLMPSLFHRLSVYPTFNEEQLYIFDYSDDIKRMIINILRDTGVVARSELVIWLKDTYKEGFIDIDAVLSDLMKRGIIKQISVKGMPSELILLTMDIFMLRIPPTELLENPVQRGLPTHLVKNYQNEVKRFFNEYHPTEEDNLKILNVISKPQVYETLKLLRTAIVTMRDLEKLRKKGVEDLYGVLKMLWDNEIIKVFQDENKNEYYALLSDFYLDKIFP
ncbi:MAG: hypothetical protein ACFFA6_15100, partial [Promethearchaeota archaeon]